MPKAFDLGNPRVMTSTEALEIEDIPENLLVVGGGYIGMELGTVYAALGSKIVLVEALDAILAGADADLARPVVANAGKMFKEIRLKAKVVKMATVGKQIKVESEYNGEKFSELYDRVLVSVGRVPNSKDLGLQNTKVELDERGFVKVNSAAADERPGDLRHRRHRGRHPARAQGAQGGAHRRRSHHRRKQRVRQRDSRRRFHRSRNRLVRPDGK
jgi:dihydrolipoamide dehydrogenase